MTRLFTSYIAAYRGLPGAVWALTAATFVNSAGRMVLTLLALFLTQARGYDVALAGQIVAAFGVGSVAGGYLGGNLCDRLPLRQVLAGALALNGLGYIAILAADAPWQYFAVVLAAGLFEGAYRPAFSIALMRLLPAEDRARGHSLNRTAINLGVAMGAAGGGLLAAWDFALVFWADGLTCLLAAALLWRVVRAVPAQPAPRPAGGGGPGSPWRDGWFMAFNLVLLLSGLVFFQIQATYGPYLASHYGLGTQAFGLLFALNGLLIVACELPLVTALKRRDRFRIAGFGALLVGIGFAMLPFGTSVGYAVLAMVVLSFGEMILYPMAMSIAMDRAAEGRQGATMSAYFTMAAAARLGGPALGSLLYDTAGPEALWASCGAVGIVCWFAMELLRRSQRRPAHQAAA